MIMTAYTKHMSLERRSYRDQFVSRKRARYAFSHHH